MLKHYQPDTVHSPPAAYSHAVEVPAGARTLFLAGQGGRYADGTRGTTIQQQADQTWVNILAVLAAADMAAEDIVRVTTYVSDAAFRDETGAARKRAIGDLRPGGTFLVVAGFAMPDMLIEIDVIAAKA